MSDPPPPQPRAAGWIFYDRNAQIWRLIPANLSFGSREKVTGKRSKMKQLGEKTSRALSVLAKGRRKTALANRRIAIAHVMGVDIGILAHVSDELEVDFPTISKREQIGEVMESCAHLIRFLLAGREKRLELVIEPEWERPRRG